MSSQAPKLHWGARIEDAFHAWRRRRARRRGHIAMVIPFSGYGSTDWVRVLARVVFARPDGPKKKQKSVARGWRSFTSVAFDYAEVWVTVGNERQRVLADRGGVVDLVVRAPLTPGWQSIGIQSEDSVAVTAPVFIVAPEITFGVISDIDDTVMVTALPKPFVAFWTTFVLDEYARTAVPGMSVLYERLVQTHPGSPVMYLSTGAWNVAPTIDRFLSRNLFPGGPLLLTDWGPTHDRFFRSGAEHKRRSLARLASDFPSIKWLLIGDDGQHDEERYGELIAESPDSVFAVAIRQLSAGEVVLAGGRERADDRDLPGEIPWFLSPDGAGLSEQLEEHGLL